MNIRDDIQRRWAACSNAAERSALLNQISTAVDSLFPAGRRAVQIPALRARLHLDCIQSGELLMPFEPPTTGTTFIQLASAVDAALCYEAAAKGAELDRLMAEKRR